MNQAAHLVSRRGVLAGGIGLSASNFLHGGQGSARPQKSTTPANRIDTHHHFLPSPLISALDKAGRGGPAIGSAWTASKDIEDMDRGGTRTAVLSLTNNAAGMPKQVLHECNEYAAMLRSDYPGRFGNFAAIPLPDVDAALREVEYALDTLKADGIGVYSSYGNKWLGDPSFAPVWEELNRRRAVVFEHPVVPDASSGIPSAMGVSGDGAWIEFGADTARAIASVIFTGTSTRFPEITWIFSHGGGVVPFLIERFLERSAETLAPGTMTGIDRTALQKVPKGAWYELRRMYYDTAIVGNPISLEALRRMVPVSHILYGTDFWYRRSDDTSRNLLGAGVFNEPDLRAITRDNALGLLPKFKLE